MIMNKIKIMDENLANKIAAGEVVEKCMNVVKELVENSIDAGSNVIKIELLESGVKQIKVTDNGIGMSKEDAKLAFSRHATSKLYTLDDLFNIDSLGFRGEALPSIAAVSKLALKTSNGEEGTEIVINGGKIESIDNSDLKKGTSITVCDLFYNTPVRLKYIKNLYIELANILEYVDKMALSYPDISFTVSNDGKVLLSTDGSGDLLKVIYKIYGKDVAKKMIEVNDENDDYTISGYISYPENTRSSRNSITTLVNGRVIKNNELNRIIIDCYHTYIHKGRYPIIVLNIEVDPILIDINIHPTKMDIKFSKMNTLKDLISKSISKKLSEINLIPDSNVRDNLSVNDVLDQIKNTSNNEENIKIDDTNNYEEITFDFEVHEESKELELNEARVPKMEYIGVYDLTFIIASSNEGLCLIDQHGAAERIKYEKLLKQINEKDSRKQELLIPIKIELPKNEAIILNNNINIIKNLNIDIEEFGDNTFIIRSHPLWIDNDYAESSIRDIIEIVINNKDFSYEKFVDSIITSIACHTSIKAHDYISESEVNYILENIRYCDNPFTCPHGRPTIIKFTVDEIKKMFKRDYRE